MSRVKKAFGKLWPENIDEIKWNEMTAKIRLQERFFATSWPENMSAKNSAAKKFSPHCGLQTCLPLQKCWVCQRWRNQMTAKYSKNLRISHLDTYTLGLDICKRSMFVSQRAKIYANDSSIPLWSFQVYFYHTVQNHYWIQNKLIQFQKRLLEQSMSFKVSDATLARTVG